MPIVTIGIHSGTEIEEPRRFHLLRSKEDRDQSLAVFVAFVKIANVSFIEIEGPTEDNSGWILAGYGMEGSPSVAQLTKIKDNCNSRILVNVWWDKDRVSKDSYEGYHFTGAIMAIIQKYTDPVEHRSAPSSLIRDRDRERDGHILKSRQHKLLHTKERSKLPLSKRSNHSYKSSEIEAMIKQRGLFTKVLDFVAGVTPDDLRKTLRNNHQHHDHSDEDHDDLDRDDSHYHHDDNDDDDGRYPRSSSSSSAHFRTLRHTSD